MKILQFSWVVLLGFLFFACQKDFSKSTDGTQQLLPGAPSKGGGGSTPPPAFVFTAPTFGTGCAGTDYCFDAYFTTKGGTDPGGNNSITVSISQGGLAVAGQDPVVVESTTGHFCFSGLEAGQYTVLVYFRHAGSDNAQPVNVPLSFTLTVQSSELCGGGVTYECTSDGVSLTRSSTIVETDINGTAVSVTANYIVHNCTADAINKLKLQGGLVNKATLISASAVGDIMPTPTNKLGNSSGNTVITWTFDLPGNATETFTTVYSVYPTACGNPLSGAWSLKNSAGVPIGVSASDMSATQSGYLDRLYWVCP